MVTALTLQLEQLTTNQRTLIAVGVLMAAVFASLGLLFLVSETAVDAQAVNSFSDAMIVDARSAIFRPGGTPVVE